MLLRWRTKDEERYSHPHLLHLISATLGKALVSATVEFYWSTVDFKWVALPYPPPPQKKKKKKRGHPNPQKLRDGASHQRAERPDGCIGQWPKSFKGSSLVVTMAIYCFAVQAAHAAQKRK